MNQEEVKEAVLTEDELIYEQNQTELEEMLASGKITKRDYILHADEDLHNGYLDWCEDNGISDNDESAERYWNEIVEAGEDFSDSMSEEEYSEENAPEDDGKTKGAEALYADWNLNQTDKVREMAHSHDAAVVTCWRYGNPISKDKNECSNATGLDKETVEKWWNVADYIYGANGCQPVTPIDDKVETMQSIINQFAKIK
ncbi:MAG: hypothetical protein PUF37_07785 [Prevotellaceae bacterium]|nr:hypothetical protein [Prevotellaceae bacterium]